MGRLAQTLGPQPNAAQYHPPPLIPAHFADWRHAPGPRLGVSDVVAWLVADKNPPPIKQWVAYVSPAGRADNCMELGNLLNRDVLGNCNGHRITLNRPALPGSNTKRSRRVRRQLVAGLALGASAPRPNHALNLTLCGGPISGPKA